EAYNITSTINDIINMAMARKENKQVELIVDCDANMPSGLLGDEKKIRRVIMNLVNNAIKYTNEGGIVIRVYTRKEEYGANLCISVRDTGIGMSEEELENVFDSFSQVDTKRNRQEGGIGLGLAISKALLQKMGGVITVRSRLGKGSDFRFVVPQKVLDEKPITQVKNREKLNIAAYFDMEQFDMMAIRDEYSTLIMHMVKQLRVRCHVCRNLAELKRREEIEAFTHIFISLEEYQEDVAYFDELAKKISVAIVIERYNDKFITNQDVIRLYKPFYILPVVSILNGSREAAGGKQMVRPGKFTAPDAHVLVVDDNRMNIRVVEGLLKEYQIKVTYATSGHEALDVIENMSYDFVFMDHMMPEMDGIETLHRIRDKVGRYYQTVPIIALTANAAPGNREMFLEEGFDDFVEKPLEISVLERVLRRNLPEEKIVYNDVHDVKTQDGETENKEIEQEKNKETKGTNAAASDESGLVIGDLDVEKGIMYCGSKKAYLEILEDCYEDGAEERALIEKLFEDKDWANYTIKVHAVKSTMKSIGANVLFEKAKALETAGRNNDIDYIMKNHNDMLDEHRRVMNELAQSPLLSCKAQESIVSENNASVENNTSPENNTALEELPELEDETLDKLLGEMEDAAYSLDGEGMLSVLSEMQKYRYCDVCLKDKLSSVGKKIEKSDLMSALDNVSKICNDLKNKQKGDSAE
ncbi:MAG: response regulator, partial [Lachnospiraceae bacterium]|nr:response regulator [Lachnospiraceae bacterium]